MGRENTVCGSGDQTGLKLGWCQHLNSNAFTVNTGRKHCHVPVNHLHLDLWKVLAEGLQSQLVLVLQGLVQLVVPVESPWTHVVRVEALLDQRGHDLSFLHQGVLPPLLLPQKVHTHQLNGLFGVTHMQ